MTRQSKEDATLLKTLGELVPGDIGDEVVGNIVIAFSSRQIIGPAQLLNFSLLAVMYNKFSKFACPEYLMNNIIVA